MDKLIDKLEEKPLSNKDLMKSLNNQTKILKYDQLSRYNNISDVLYPYNNFILLYQNEKLNSGHWVCVLKNRDCIEFFDPYGLFIDEQMNFLNYKQPLYLSKLLLDSGYKIIYNNKRFQEFGSDVNTCGRHVLIRLICRHLNLKQYQDLYKNQKLNPDDIVTMMTSYL